MKSGLFLPTLFVAAIFAVTCISPRSYAQAPKDSPTFGDREPDEIVVVPLSHGDPRAIAKAITELQGTVRATWVAPKSVVLRGPKERVQIIIDQVIATLDAPSEGSGTSSIARFTPVAPGAMRTVRELSRAVISSRQTQIAFDDRQGMVVVRGPDRDVEAIRRLVSQIDGTRSPLNVMFFFLRGRFGGDASRLAPDIPSSLKPVVQPLMENGLHGVYLMAPVWVRADEGQNFESESYLENAARKPGDSSENLRFKVRGRAQMPSRSETVHIEIHAEVEGEHTTPGATSGSTNFNVSTTITAALGDYVILALAPSSSANGNAIALVVRVTPG